MATDRGLEALFDKNESEKLMNMSSLGTDDGIKYVGKDKTILAVLNEFRTDEERGFCDVVIEVEGADFPAHRCILAANSQLFYNMFNSGMRESGERRLKLHSISREAMTAMLQFFYTREITIKEDNLEKILDAASFFLVKPVQEACVEVLSGKLGSTNCFNVKHLAEKYGASELFAKADSFTKKHFSHISKESEEFVRISMEDLSSLILSDQILVEKEEDVYSAVMRWVSHDLPNRVELLPHLLSQLKYGSLSKLFIKGQLQNEPLIKDCEASRTVLEGWIKVKSRKRRDRVQKPQPIRPSTKAHDVVISFCSDDDEITGFDVDTKEHIKLPCLPRCQTNPSIAVVNQAVYIVGGQNIYNSTIESNHVRSLSFESDSRQQLAWEEKASFSESRSASSVAVLGKHIYLLGGFSLSHDKPVETVECYDSETDLWKVVSSLCAPRGDIGAVGMQNCVLAIGGSIDSRRTSSNVVEKYSPAQNSWLQVAPLKVERSAPHTAFFHGKVYAVGGNGSSGCLSSCEVYNPCSNEWSLITKLQHPHEQINLTMLVGILPLNGTLNAVFADCMQDTMKVLKLNKKSYMLEDSEVALMMTPSLPRLPCKVFVIQVGRFHLELLPTVKDNPHMSEDDDDYYDENDFDYLDYFDDYEDDYIYDDDYVADWGADWM